MGSAGHPTDVDRCTHEMQLNSERRIEPATHTPRRWLGESPTKNVTGNDEAYNRRHIGRIATRGPSQHFTLGHARA
jgi:hypothetical protein